jgi:hypothetical protein
MKKLTIAFLAVVLAVSFAGLAAAKDEIPPRQLRGPAGFAAEVYRDYFEGFEGVFPPDGWTHTITLPGNTWFQSTSVFEGSYAAQVLWQDIAIQHEVLSFDHTIDVAGGEYWLNFATMGSLVWAENANFTVEVNGTQVYDFFNEFTAGSWVWDVVSIDLSAWDMQPVTISFIYSGLDGADHHLDAVVINDGPPPPPPPFSFCDLVQDVDGTGFFSGNTCDGINSFSESPFHSWTFQGLEHYYGVFMPAGSSFTINLEHTVDSAIWLVDGCVEPFTTLAVVDDVWPEGFETLSYTNTGGDTYVFLVIDSFGTGTCGDYTFEFTSAGGAVATEMESLSGVKSLFR